MLFWHDFGYEDQLRKSLIFDGLFLERQQCKNCCNTLPEGSSCLDFPAEPYGSKELLKKPFLLPFFGAWFLI